MKEKTRTIQMPLKGKEIDYFERLFKKSTYINRSEFMRSIYFEYVKTLNNKGQQ